MKSPRAVAFDLANAYVIGACMAIMVSLGGAEGLMRYWWLIVATGVVVGGGYWHERLCTKATGEHPS